MFNSETLEVGIGMAFLFLLMSLICTGVNEWIEGIFRWRAMDLERALRTLLNDDDGRLTALLFAHPQISALHQGDYLPLKLEKRGAAMCGRLGFSKLGFMPLAARRTLPSYIPAANFATALIDLVGRGPVGGGGADGLGVPLTVEQLRERAAAPDSPCSPYLRRAILSALDHCEGDLRQLTQNLQRWFDSSMDRASGWYKRRTQTVLFLLGFGIAVVLNVDALHVMGRLTADKTLREAVVSAATTPPPAAPATDVIRTAREELDRIGMPIGWRHVTGTEWPHSIQMRQVPGSATRADLGHSWLGMFVGWLITAFAVMLGAPFWFDVLNKFMVIRSTVKPHEKSREEGSEDRADPSRSDPARVVRLPAAASPVRRGGDAAARDVAS